MEHVFWRERWREKKIGFHQSETNEFLLQYAERLPKGRILAPLSGKSRDLSYLANQGHEVVGCELVEEAVRAFYEEQNIPVTRREEGGFAVYEGGGVTSYAGDFFALHPAQTGPVAGVFDRAALVALPPDLRDRYVPHLLRFLAPGGVVLLVVLDYAGEGIGGPPFAISPAEVAARFGERCDMEALGEHDLLAVGGPRIPPTATFYVERAYLLRLRG